MRILMFWDSSDIVYDTGCTQYTGNLVGTRKLNKQDMTYNLNINTRWTTSSIILLLQISDG